MLAPHVAELALNRPLVIHPDKAAIIADVLAGRIGIEAPEVAMTPEASRFTGQARTAIGPRVAGGVAVVSIVGSLVNRGAWVGAYSGLVSYEGISAQLREAAADPSVHSVVLDIDSGGGEAGGITSVVSQVRALAAEKRVVAVVNDTACSGAYWLASAASEIVVSETSMVGSIGVVVLHVNRAGEMQQRGLVPTFIFSGTHKIDGHPFGPLSDSVRADVQQAIDALYGQFCAGVAAGRGKRLTAQAARATEARVFHGQAAISAGLADRVSTFEGVLADLRARPGRPARGAASRPARCPWGQGDRTGRHGPPDRPNGETRHDRRRPQSNVVARHLENEPLEGGSLADSCSPAIRRPCQRLCRCLCRGRAS